MSTKKLSERERREKGIEEEREKLKEREREEIEEERREKQIGRELIHFP